MEPYCFYRLRRIGRRRGNRCSCSRRGFLDLAYHSDLNYCCSGCGGIIDKFQLAAITIIAVAIILIVGLLTGHNGVLLSGCLTLIGFVAGSIFGFDISQVQIKRGLDHKKSDPTQQPPKKL